MTPEERFDRIERQIESVVGQQAHQAEQIQQLGDFLLRATRFVEDFARRTAEWQRRTEERFGQVDEKLGRLAEAQQRTEERLNILIGVVERYFSNGGRHS